VVFHINSGAEYLEPSTIAPFRKGDHRGSTYGDLGHYQIWATKPSTTTAIAGVFPWFKSDYRYEFYLVGTTRGNVKIVRVARAIAL
jgi:hypothetical protein